MQHTIAAPTSTAPPVGPTTDVRLPLDVTPVHYDLELRPDIYGDKEEDFIFTGRVGIEVECKKPTKAIVMHMKYLTVDNSSIMLEGVGVGIEAPKVTRYSIEVDKEFIRFHLDKDLTKGARYVLSMSFSGVLRQDLTGLYRSSYMAGNKTVWIGGCWSTYPVVNLSYIICM